PGDVQAALGISIGAGQPVSPAICTFDGAAGGVEVHVSGGDSAQAFSTLAQTPGAQKVPGLGDDAYQQPSAGTAGHRLRLDVRKGTTQFYLIASLVAAPVQLSQMEALARAAL